MPNLASVLKSEISRIARKEVRAETEGLKKAVATYRSEIAALKRRAKQLEDHVRQIGKGIAKANPAIEASANGEAVVFSAKALAKQRGRLKLSAERLALLIGVSGQTIYNWEHGVSTPQAKYVPAVSALKDLSVSQAAELVQSRQNKD